MRKEESRHIFWLITYVGILILILIHFKEILSVIGRVFGFLNVFFLGIIFAFVLNHAYEKVRNCYRKMHMKEKYARCAGIATVYLILAGILASLVWVILPQLMENIKRFILHLDTYKAELQKGLNMITNALHTERLDVTRIFGFLEQYTGVASGGMDELVPHITNTTLNVMSGIVNGGVAIVFSIYLLGGKERIFSQAKRLFQVILPKNAYAVSGYLFGVAVRTFDNYVVGQSLEAAILGGLCFIGMLLLRIDYAGMISVIIAITAFIPILGAYIGGTVAVVLLFMVSPRKALVFLIFFVILQQIENNLIYPRVVGNKIGLPGIWVLLGISVGAKAGGVLGMLFGVPTLTVAYTLLKQTVLILEEWKNK